MATKRRNSLYACLGMRLQAHWSMEQPLPPPWTWLLSGFALLYRALKQALGGNTPPARGCLILASGKRLPIIVVGNIMVGGTGKTPVVAALAKALQARGYCPGIISRGYGRRDPNRTLVASDCPPDEQAESLGDEPTWLHHITSCPVAVASRRPEAAEALLAKHPEVDVLIADDGLQHQALPRMVELVVFDDRGTGNSQLLPMGPLREPLGRLASVDAIVLAVPESSLTTPALANIRKKAPARPCYNAPPQLLELRCPARHLALIPAMFQERFGQQPIIAMAGIANPNKFFKLLHDLGLRFQALPMPDHASYGTGKLDPIFQQAYQTACDSHQSILLTTGKDAVKLDATDPRLWVAEMALKLPDALIDQIDHALRRSSLENTHAAI